jgi:sugar/nucleoside kinase (ribokinase family)
MTLSLSPFRLFISFYQSPPITSSFAQHHQPDDKIKSTSLSVMGGGNAANTLTAIRRLGMPSAMLTKLGKDSNGDIIRSELEAEGVDTSMCVRQAGLSSPFTYIIVDEMTRTRTCVHTPIQQELTPEEIPPTALDGVACLHCDSRSTIAAIAVAKQANERGIPVALDIEKERPHVGQLLPLADWIFTNTRYPSIFAPGSESLEQGMAALLEHGRANLVATTLGEEGSVLMQRAGGGGGEVAVGEAHDDISTAVYREGVRTYHVTRCKSHSPGQVVDTTGAGDAYIGAMITGEAKNSTAFSR